jgi:Ca2+/Na+ antiporter
VSVTVFGAVGYVLLGLACLAAGVKTRRGIGNYAVSRNVKVRYKELPIEERIRTGNALLVLGVTLLLCATFGLVPEPVTVVLFLAALCLFVLFVVIQRGLRRAAQQIARTTVS